MGYDDALINAIDCSYVRIMSHNTERAQNIIKSFYAQIFTHTLNDCYKKPSRAKRSAYEHCLDVCESFNGEQGTILAYNCQFFSYAFLVRRENGTCWLVYVTHKHIYAIDKWRQDEYDYECYLSEKDNLEIDELMREIDELLKNEATDD